MATENGEAEAKQFYATAGKEKQRIESRVKELDNIIRCLYEDRVCGRIPVERYDAMAVGYETEQAELKQELESITKKIEVFEKTEKYSRTAGNPIIIHSTFQPHINTDLITMTFREELLETAQAEIA